jgi:hypothetical protein
MMTHRSPPHHAGVNFVVLRGWRAIDPPGALAGFFCILAEPTPYFFIRQFAVYIHGLAALLRNLDLWPSWLAHILKTASRRLQLSRPTDQLRHGGEIDAALGGAKRMGDISRRSFFAGLSSAFGAASITDLNARILDAGRPILLTPTAVSNKLFVHEGGTLFLGDHTYKTFERVTYRQLWHDEGSVDGNNDAEVRRHAEWGWGDADIADEIIEDDRYWREAYSLTYDPPAAAYRLLKRLKIGTGIRSKQKTAGRLDFYAGSNHPGSSDLWCEAYDDLSVSLLQAELIERKQPIQLIMNTRTIVKYDDFDPDSIPADE